MPTAFDHVRLAAPAGVEWGFRPARKAHPGPRAPGIEQYASRLRARGAQGAPPVAVQR